MRNSPASTFTKRPWWGERGRVSGVPMPIYLFFLGKCTHSRARGGAIKYLARLPCYTWLHSAALRCTAPPPLLAQPFASWVKLVFAYGMRIILKCYACVFVITTCSRWILLIWTGKSAWSSGREGGAAWRGASSRNWMADWHLNLFYLCFWSKCLPIAFLSC